MGTDNIKSKRIKENKLNRKALKLRKKNVKNPIPKVLILTEGRTEEVYFNLLKYELELQTFTVRKSKFTDSIGIINEAIDLNKQSKKNGDEYDYIFCLFDLDTVNNQVFIDLMNKHNTNNKVSAKIYPIVCFPCIEFWFILQFEQYTAPFTKQGKISIGNTVKSKLKEFHPDYSETNSDILAEFVKRYKTAKYNSEELAKKQIANDSINPITNIHQLLDLMISISEKNESYEYKPTIDKFIIQHL